MDNEVAGAGNQYDYGFRIYNPRIARFLSVDPLTSSYPWYTPYQFAGNKPIAFVDLDGLEEMYHMFVENYHKETYLKKGNKSTIQKGIQRGVASWGTKTSEKLISLLELQTWEDKGTKAMQQFLLFIVTDGNWGRDKVEAYEKAGIPMLGSDDYLDMWDWAKNASAEDWIAGYTEFSINITFAIVTERVISKISFPNFFGVDDVAQNSMRRAYIGVDVDCSEVAEDLLRDMNYKGDILEIRSVSGGEFNLFEKTRKYEFYEYHQAYMKDGYVYDPYFSDDAIKFDDYVNDIQSHNKGQLKVDIVTPKE